MAFSFGEFPIKDKIVLITGGGAGMYWLHEVTKFFPDRWIY